MTNYKIMNCCLSSGGSKDQEKKQYVPGTTIASFLFSHTHNLILMLLGKSVLTE